MSDDSESRHVCRICGASARLHDVVDFNKSCREAEGVYLPLSGRPIYYVLCDRCGFCCAYEMCSWSQRQFGERVYNDAYVDVDPDYVSARPTQNADFLMKLLGVRGPELRHLDYGGGHGLLSDLLKDAGWNSTSYDPFVDDGVDAAQLGRFDLITAFEVFEHVPDPRVLASALASLMKDDAAILFSTLLSDGNVAKHRRLDWWYAAPRNGHISLFTRSSLYHLADGERLGFASFHDGFHAWWRGTPTWALFLPQR